MKKHKGNSDNSHTSDNVVSDRVNRCKTKYPVVFIHGTGFRHNKVFNYWGRIPKALISGGATIFYTNSDAWGTIEDNAESVKTSILEILEESGCEKVNLVAHSKGGLEARYLISKLDMGEYVASLTTVSTPHRGSKTLEIFNRFPSFFIRFVGLFVNTYFRILGDKRPDFTTFVKQLSTSSCLEFNRVIKNDEGVYYQSYASKMKNSFSDILLFFPHLVLKIIEGDNDGIVTVESAKWGEFQGIITGDKLRGVSHADVLDIRRMNSSGFDIRETYVKMIEGLVNKGF